MQNGDIWSFLFFVLLFLFGPKLYMWQMMYRLENELKKLETYMRKSESIVLKSMSSKPTKEMREKLEDYMDFFVVQPVSLDPHGIVDKLDVVLNESERKLKEFALEMDPKLKGEELTNVVMGMKGALGATQIYKIVRHFILLSKKMNNLQYIMMLQMQLPIIMKIAKANVSTTRALANAIPIGDSIGPMAAASFKTKVGTEIVEDVVLSKETIQGKNVYVMKSKGPASSLGKQGDAVKDAIKRYKIDYIIAIDASSKFEGEKTGRVAEGVGVPMGGAGVQRSRIEDSVTDKKVRVDAIVIKQGLVDAGIPMKKEIFKSLPNIRDKVSKYVKASDKKNILVVGVGNTAGIGNVKSSLKGVEKKLRPDWKKYDQKKKEEEEKKKNWWKF